MVKHVNLVEHNNHWKLWLVKDAERIQHIAHERVWIFTPNCVCNVQADSRESAAKTFSDNLSRRWLRKCLDLSWSVNNHKVQAFLFFFDQADDLVELGGEDIQRSQDRTIWSKLVLLHDSFVLDRVSNINVCLKLYIQDSWVKIDIIGFLSLFSQKLCKLVNRKKIKWEFKLTSTNVVLPLPAIPKIIKTKGCFFFGY